MSETASATADADSAREGKTATPGKATAQKPAGGKDAAKKKAGKQLGAQGFGRTQKLAFTNAEAHHPRACAGCGKCLAPDGALAYTAWDDVDSAEKVAGQAGLYQKVTRHTLYVSACSCGHVTRAAHNVAPDDPF
ncbi:MAG TPA: hypothetical protein DCW29_03420 [Janthinobacterium sp.]|nr:hypothetical protein [Janthinobacterium sp.]